MAPLDKLQPGEAVETLGVPQTLTYNWEYDTPRRRLSRLYERSGLAAQFRHRLFSKIVPNVKSLGLLSERQRQRFHTLDILQYESGTTSDVDHDADLERRIRSGEVAAA